MASLLRGNLCLLLRSQHHRLLRVHQKRRYPNLKANNRRQNLAEHRYRLRTQSPQLLANRCLRKPNRRHQRSHLPAHPRCHRVLLRDRLLLHRRLLVLRSRLFLRLPSRVQFHPLLSRIRRPRRPLRVRHHRLLLRIQLRRLPLRVRCRHLHPFCGRLRRLLSHVRHRPLLLRVPPRRLPLRVQLRLRR